MLIGKFFSGPDSCGLLGSHGKCVSRHWEVTLRNEPRWGKILKWFKLRSRGRYYSRIYSVSPLEMGQRMRRTPAEGLRRTEMGKRLGDRIQKKAGRGEDLQLVYLLP